MVFNLYKKQNIVTEINKTANKAISLIVVDTSGIKVNELNKLRQACRKTEEIHLFSTRNSLMIRGLKNTEFCKMQNMLQGQCMIGFSFKTPDITAKVFNDFSKNIDNPRFIKGVCVENKIITGKQLDILITLPNYEGAVIKFLFLLKYISVGILANLLYQVLLIKQKY